MAMGKVRIGIVGLGFMAATHLRAYQKVPAAEIAALIGSGVVVEPKAAVPA